MNFMGMRVYEAPPPPPKIEVRDIRLRDGTPILSPEFRREMNAWLVAQFGYRENRPPLGTAYLFGSNIVVNRNDVLRLMRDTV